MDCIADDQLKKIEHHFSDTNLFFDKAKVAKGIRQNGRGVNVKLRSPVQKRRNVHFDRSSNMVEPDPCIKC